MRQLATAVLLCCFVGQAQNTQPTTTGEARTPPTEPLTLKQAIEFAARNYPTIRAGLAEVSASESSIELSKTAYLPRTDLYFQTNRATRNNIFGLILPNPVIPAISGPVQEDSTIASTFGSAAGVLLSWEPFDFGLRKANVALAESLRRKAQAGLLVTEFEISLAVTDAFFRVAGGQQAVTAAQANVDRMKVFADAVAVLVKNELRPGADESRAQSELARATTELIQARGHEAQARVSLSKWLGVVDRPIDINLGRLLEPPPSDSEAGPELQSHPIAQAQSAEIDVVRARRRSLEKAYRPRFELLSAVYGRGSGARLDGTFKGAAHGLAPSEGNWAVGMSVKFPIFDYKENQTRRMIEQHREEAESARYDDVIQQLKARIAEARVDVDSALRIAQNTPIQLQAAQTLESQARQRYQTGLGTVVEVAEAQRLLLQAEIEDSLARLGVWRSLFQLAAAEGDMSQVLDQSSP